MHIKYSFMAALHSARWSSGKLPLSGAFDAAIRLGGGIGTLARAVPREMSQKHYFARVGHLQKFVWALTQ
jgi:hypothetical protein